MGTASERAIKTVRTFQLKRFPLQEAHHVADEIARGELISSEEAEARMDVPMARWDKEMPRPANDTIDSDDQMDL